MNLNSLNNLKKFDYKRIINVVKNNYDKDAGLFTIVLVLIIFFGVRQFVQPALSKLSENITKLSQIKTELKQYQDKEMFMANTESQQAKQNLPVKVYNAPYPGMDTETASVELVQEIIKIIKETGNNRINNVDFTTKNLGDSSGANSSDYGVLSLNISLEGPFDAIQNALNEIFLMKYLVVIKKINSAPLDNFDYDIIKSDLTLDLYIKTGGSQDSNAEGGIGMARKFAATDQQAGDVPPQPAGSGDPANMQHMGSSPYEGGR